MKRKKNEISLSRKSFTGTSNKEAMQTAIYLNRLTL